MTRSKLLTVTAAIGIFVGTLGLGAVTSQAFAAATPGATGPADAPAQAAPTPTATCPFLTADGTVDLDAMHEWMDAIHGEGWFEQMWARMTAAGVTPGTGTGAGLGTGICPLGLGTGPGTGLAPQDGTGFQYGMGAGRRGGMMGAGFGFGANR